MRGEAALHPRVSCAFAVPPPAASVPRRRAPTSFRGVRLPGPGMLVASSPQ
ncbi:hypothetical protein HVPorG_05014 [Roseomonas mucosa]|nr:hypothetical protein HVPorG_05014 [Roseomonas mucosa]